MGKMMRDQDEEIAATGSSCGSASGLPAPTERPRLRVFRSVSHIYVQVIDDVTRHDDRVGRRAPSRRQGRSSSGAARRQRDGRARRSARPSPSGCKEKGIKRVVFDRGGFLYHGRVRAVAEAAREAGLEF